MKLQSPKEKSEVIGKKDFELFYVIESIAERIDFFGLLPSDRPLIALYNWKYNNKTEENLESIIKEIIPNLSNNNWKPIFEAMIYSYIALIRNGNNYFDKIESAIDNILDLIQNMNHSLLDVDLAFSLGLIQDLTSNHLKNKINDTMNSISNDLFRLNYYLGLSTKSMWDNPRSGKYTLNEGDEVANKVYNYKEYSPMRKLPALLYIREEDKNNLIRKIVSEMIDIEFYKGIFGITLESNYIERASPNFSPSFIFRFLLVFKLLDWDRLVMVPPDLLQSAMELKKYGSKGVAISKTKLKILKIGYVVIFGVLSVYFYHFYNFISIIISVASFCLAIIFSFEKKFKGEKND